MTRFHSTSGSALLLVLWAIAILSVTIMGVIEFVNFGLEETTARAQAFRARQLAESGIAFGLNPKIVRGDPLLSNYEVSPEEHFDVHLTTEGGRLPINQILRTNQRSILIALFQKWNVNSKDISIVIDSLEDWIDPDDLQKLNGAENNYYAALGHPEFPPNRPLLSVDEMSLVRGMDVVAAHQPNWRDYFTVWSDGKLDVNEAPAELLEVVCGISPAQSEAVIQRRLGGDQLPDTKDDYRFKTLEEFRQAAGIPTYLFDNVQKNITVQDPVLRIESTGRVGHYQKTIIVLARGTNNGPRQYLSWQEK